MKKQIAQLLTMSAVTTFLFAAPASANLDTVCGSNTSAPAKRWPTSTPPAFKMLPSSFGNWSLQHFALAAAVQQWNVLPDSDLNMGLTFDDDSTFNWSCPDSDTACQDGNEVLFAGVSPDGNTPYAVTKWKVNNCTDHRLIETDIVFFWWESSLGTEEIEWNYTMTPGNVTGINNQSNLPDVMFTVVASHEIGHAIGLEHSWFTGARMEDHYPIGGWTPSHGLATPLGLDAWEAHLLYPNALSTTSKVRVANMQPGLADTELLGFNHPPGGTESQVTWPFNLSSPCSEPNCAFPGQTVTFRACAHNLGGVTSPDVFALAELTNGAGTAIGTAAANGVMQLPKMSTHCREYSFVVPSVAPGTYDVRVTLYTGFLATFGTVILNRPLEVF